MKRKHFKGITGFVTTIRIGCAAGIGMMTSQIQAGSPAPTPAEAEVEVPANWVDFTVGGASTSGDQAAYQRRVGQDGDFYGGISDMHWEQESNDITWTLDGHAMFGNEDYEAILGAQKEGLGYIKAGYNQFRTWYDGSGGYVPVTDGWFSNDDELSVDRGEVWFEAGLRMEDLPEITFNYSHRWRDGEKDSTSWGQSGSYKIAPSLNVIDEETDTFTLDITHTLGNTDLGLGLRYMSVNNEDSRIMGSGVSPSNSGAGNTVEDTAVYDSNLFNAHMFSESRFGERVLASFGYSYTNLDTDVSGDRPSRDNTTNILETGADHASWGMTGGSQAQIHVLNANLWWNPVDDLVIVPSFRAEFWDQSAETWHLAGVRGRNVSGDADQAVEDALNGIFPADGSPNEGRLEEVHDSSGNQWEEFTEALEVRYSGLENVLAYANAEWTQSEGDYFRETIGDFHTVPETVEVSHRRTDSDLDIQKYTIGANWYPVRGLSFSAQAYYKSYEQDLDFDIEDDDAQISNHNNETNDINLRMTWRALPNLTFVTRYDYQQTDIETRGVNANPVEGETTLNIVESADIESNIISQSVTWLPLEQMYVQGVFSYVMSETDTPSDKYAPQRIADSDNDYVMANLTVGYALDRKTEITAGYSFYYSENYDMPYATNGTPGSVGFGTDLEEHVFSLSLTRQINPNMVWNMGYGYYNSNEGTVGGNNAFDAHMVSTGLQVRF